MPATNAPPQNKPSSWAEKVRVSDSSMRCNLEQMARRPAGSILKIPQDMQLADGLSMAASMVGKPIASDVATMQCTRLEFARVCVEIDAEVPLVHNFKVMSTLSEDPISVDVSYEWKPARCATCRVFGHSCKSSERQEDLTVKDQEGEQIALNDIPSKGTAEKEGTIAVPDPELVIAKVLPKDLIIREAEVSSTETHQNTHKVGDTQTTPHEYPTICLENKMASLTRSWNIRGLNTSQSQYQVLQWINKNNLDVLGLLETRIKEPNLAAVQANFLPSRWEAISNISYNPICRIILGWNSQKFKVQLVHASAQWITCSIRSPNNVEVLKITIVYASNSYKERTVLWHYLLDSSVSYAAIPWAIMGDFNATLRPGDCCGGSNNWGSHHNDFSNCILQASLQQIPYSGLRLSWHNGQSGSGSIMKKLDWIFGNLPLMIKWPETKAKFLPRGASDHSAMVLSLGAKKPRAKPSFKFLNQWSKHDDFLPIQRIVGNPIFQLTTKLNILKNRLRIKHKQTTSHISHKVFKAKEAWERAQMELDRDPQRDDLKIMERQLANQFMVLSMEEEAMFKQRARVQWLKLGDKNTKFFHRTLIHRRAQNSINSMQRDNGMICTDMDEMGSMAVNYYKNLLSSSHDLGGLSVDDLYCRSFSEEAQLRLEGGLWTFPHGNARLQEMWDSILFQPNSSQEDVYVWTKSASGNCLIKSVWETFRAVGTREDSARILWHPWHIPRHSFVLWLAARGRLRTLDRIHNDAVDQRRCILCCDQDESHNHLFFSCKFSSEVWTGVATRGQIQWSHLLWTQAWEEALHTFDNMKNPWHRVAGIVIASAIYHIWKE
ncbi:hypothetical protein SADUNF_Sadunf17G0006000 [Salix dunnii]|uniref:Reverse transcriptase zinc-binding domain-containing protein n=1 Tax=Salix dunnii TaxID=1413687 RepID=A0A835MJE7_9ROSI|nr:hypothetical protein SADUNF_Sadunf17G0006000 [Salix dunnii]